jgi:hypothetical protein
VSRHIERERTEGRNRIENHAPAGGPHNVTDGGEGMHHAGAGLGVDQADMRDRGVGGKRAGDVGRLDRQDVGCGHPDDRGTAFVREARHPLRVRPGHRDQQPSPCRHNAAQCRLDGEVAAPLQWQNGVDAGDASGEDADPLADAGIERAKRCVPRREIMSHRRADFRPG